MADIGYVEPPVTPDSAVYQRVSKDESNANNHEAAAAIQYGNNTTAVSSENGETSSSGTIAIEVAEVVNLLGGDVASDGSRMELSNADAGNTLAVESTEEGYLKVGDGTSESSIGIETEDGTLMASTGRSYGSAGYGSGASSSGRNSQNTGNSRREGGSAEGDGTLSFDNVDWLTNAVLQQDEKKNKEDEENKEKSEEGDGRKAEAAITYNDVA